MPNSPLSSKSLLWITDPWRTLDREQDTTLRLAQEAVNLGIKTYWSASDQVLEARSGFLKVFPFPNEAGAEPESAMEISPSKFDQIHYRIDPPVDIVYRKLLDDLVLRGVKYHQIKNPPRQICGQSEKIPPRELLHLAPPHFQITSQTDAVRAYPTVKTWKAWVSKPMNLAQSIGVKQRSAPMSIETFLSDVESDSDRFKSPILAQAFLSGISEGEVRMWFARGKFIAALKKYPAEGDFRVLIDQGSRIEAHHLNLREQEIAQEVGTSLYYQGTALAAIDFIDGWISDFNITSPGLLVQLEKIHGKNFAKDILEIILSER